MKKLSLAHVLFSFFGIIAFCLPLKAAENLVNPLAATVERWVLVTDVAELTNGSKIIIVSEGESESSAMSNEMNTNFINRTEVEIQGFGSQKYIGKIKDNILKIEVIKTSNSSYSFSFWTENYQSNQGYLANTSNGNCCRVNYNPSNGYMASVVIGDSGNVDINFNTSNGNPSVLRYCNSEQPARFACYGPDENLPIQIYKKTQVAVELGEIIFTVNDEEPVEEDGKIKVEKGNEFKFSAENATDIKVMVDGVPANGKFENGEYTWSVSDYYKDVKVEVTASLDKSDKTREFILYVLDPRPETPTVRLKDSVLENGAEVTLLKGTRILIESEDAKWIEVTQKDNDYKLETAPFEFEITDEGDITIVGVNPDKRSEPFAFTAIIGKDPQLGFMHPAVRGKAGVGVLSQAAHHLGKGTVTYSVWEAALPNGLTSLSPTNDIKINPNTGMIRPSDIANASPEKTYVVKAHIDPADGYTDADAYYSFVIEAPEVAIKDSGTFTFEDCDANTSTLFAKDNPALKLTLSGNYELSKEESVAEFRIFETGEIKISTTTGYLKKIEITGASLKNLAFKNNDGERCGEWRYYDDNYRTCTWRADKEVSEVVAWFYDPKDYLSIVELEVTLSGLDQDKGREMVDLSFDEGERIINTFVGETTNLPVLSQAGGEDITFENIKLGIDELEAGKYELQAKDYNDISIKVDTPGVYTFRAEYPGDEKHLKGMAILRLNVFPKLSVTTVDEAQLADHTLNLYPELILVDQRDKESVELTLPKVGEFDSEDDELLFSVFGVGGIRTCSGDGKVSEEAGESFGFTEDGFLKYELSYAATDNFKAEGKIHVVFMPQSPAWEADGEGNFIVTAPRNATLEYYYCLVDPLTGDEKSAEGAGSVAIKRKIEVLGYDEEVWQTAPDDQLVTSLDAYRSTTDNYAVRVRSSKALPEEVTADSALPAETLRSDSELITLAEGTVTVTVGAFDAREWNASGVALKEVISSSTNADLSDYVTVSIEPNGFEVVAEPTQATSSLPVWLWNQMLDIEKANYTVDGYLTAMPEISLTGEGSTGSISVASACSGLYTVTFSKAEGVEADVKFVSGSGSVEADAEGGESYTADLSIYPCLTNDYSYTLSDSFDNEGKPIKLTDDCLNINGFRMVGNEEQGYHILYAETTEGALYDEANLSKSLLIVPGLYLENLYYSFESGADITSGYTRATDGYYLDLSSLSKNKENGINLYLIASKNGATMPAPLSIHITPSTTVMAPTGLGTIVEDCEEAEYYDLNGFRVDPTRLSKGIYVRVCSGRASKVKL